MYLWLGTSSTYRNVQRCRDLVIMATVHLLLISFCLPQLSGAFTPVVYNPKVHPSSQCGQSNPFEDDPQLMEKLKMIHQQLPPPGCNPPSTCRDVLRCNPSASSGYYQIQAANGLAVQVYCDMEGTNCGGEGGWMRVAHLNMTDPSSQCPAGFKVETVNSTDFCIRNTTKAGCSSMVYESYGVTYSQVCGYARGYAYNSPDAFRHTCDNEVLCVDGISITYGSPLSHVWTYVADFKESGPYSCYNTTKLLKC